MLVKATNLTDLKKNLTHYIDLAVNGDSIIITRPKSENAVLISESEYNRLITLQNNTLYLQKINRSLEQAKEGKVVVKEFEELEGLADE